MASTDRGRAQTLGRFQAWMGRRQPVRVVTDLRVYQRGAGDQPEICEILPDLDVIIHPETGERWHACDWHPEDWARVAGELERVDLPITCHAKQVPAILSTAKVVGLLSGARGGKSEVMAWWLVRQWILRGPQQSTTGTRPGLYWWIGPNHSHAFDVGVTKLRTILPRRLRNDGPSSPRSADISFTLMDGCRIEFHHAHGDGRNLQGKSIQAGCCDEITAWRDFANWQVLIDRTSDTDAPLAVGSTPRAGHWAREEIILRSRDVPDVEHHEFSRFDNPWIPESAIWRQMVTRGVLSQDDANTIAAQPDLDTRASFARGLVDDPLTLREVFGVWTAEGVSLYGDFDPAGHTVSDRPTGQIVTPLALRKAGRFSNRESARVGGMDFNVNPMTAVVAEVVGTPGEPGDWVLYVLDEVQTVGNIHAHALNLSRRYPGIPISCDATGARPGTHPSQGATDAQTHPIILGAAGFDCVPCHVHRATAGSIATPQNPSQVDSVNLVNSLMRQGRIKIHKRCRALREGLETATRLADGRIDKVSGRRSDRLSSAPDALRYLAWHLFSHEWTGNRVSWR